MRAAHFILNTDYVTSQNDAEAEVSVTLPSSFYVPKYQNKYFSSTITIPGSASKDYRCYFTSTAFNYAITGCFGGQLKYGSSDVLEITITRAKDKFTLTVWNAANLYDKTYSGTSQVVTAHIQTFVDPFQVWLCYNIGNWRCAIKYAWQTSSRLWLRRLNHTTQAVKLWTTK